MIKKILPLTAAALMALTACSDDSSSSPSGPSESDVPSCSAKKKSSNSVEMIYSIPGISTSTITTTLMGEKVQMDIFTKYSSSAPLDSIRAECEENKLEAQEDPENSSVTCTDRTITIKSTRESGGVSIEKLYEKAVGECMVFEKMFQSGNDNYYDEEDDDDDGNDSPIHENNGPIFTDPSTPSDNDTPLLGDESSDNRPGKATCRISQNTDTNFEMIVSDADTATMFVYMKYVDGNVEENSITIFNENIPQSFIDQECAEAKEDALEDADGSVVTCEGNVISQILEMESPFNPIPLMSGLMVEYCNEIQETGIIPDDDEDF